MKLHPTALRRRYAFEHEVGLWTFGSEQVVKDRGSGLLKTCKAVPRHALIGDGASFIEGLQNLKSLHHPCLCCIEDVVEDANGLYVITERCDGGDVSEWLTKVQEQGYRLQEETVVMYMRQALRAIAHCHSAGVYHHDLRASSLVLTSRLPNAEVKVCDIGLAPLLDPEGETIRMLSNPYVAPEIMTGFGRILGHAPDIWSVGAIAHALLVGRPPQPLLEGCMVGFGAPPRRTADDESGWAQCSALSRDFVEQLLAPTKQRPTAARALQHPWLSGQASPEAVVEEGSLQRNTACYMLAVLLMPMAVHSADVESFHAAFVAADKDHDSLIARSAARRILEDHGASAEDAAAAAKIADVRHTEVLDFSALLCAHVLAKEVFKTNKPKQKVSALQSLLELLFRYFGDVKGLATNSLSTQLESSAAIGDLERLAGIEYKEIIASLPESKHIDRRTLVAALTETGGRGTPLGHIGEDCNQRLQRSASLRGGSFFAAGGVSVAELWPGNTILTGTGGKFGEIAASLVKLLASVGNKEGVEEKNRMQAP